jgi:hypothetical protein
MVAFNDPQVSFQCLYGNFFPAIRAQRFKISISVLGMQETPAGNIGHV